MTHPHPKRRFVPQAVLTMSGKINTTGENVNTAIRPVNTAGSKPTVNHPRSLSNAYKRGYSQVTRLFNKFIEEVITKTIEYCLFDVVVGFHRFMWCAHGCLIFIMESMDLIRLLEVCSWLYDVYEEAAGVIDIGLIFNHGAIDVYRLWI
ncbi:hypothetical protein Tco_0676649 [Tanacetum coccineum]